jgi:restriction system protein
MEDTSVINLLYVVIAFILIVVLAILLLPRLKRNRQTIFTEDIYSIDLHKIDITDIDKMSDGHDFEIYLFRLFQALGYKAYKTVGSRDFGADLVFNDSDGDRTVVQAKRYALDNPVGLTGVQEVFSSMRYYKAKKSLLITSSHFTEACETLAGINHVKLIDRNDLIAIINGFKQGDIEQAIAVIESEPRMILPSWTELLEPENNIKRDYKVEKRIKQL